MRRTIQANFFAQNILSITCFIIVFLYAILSWNIGTVNGQWYTSITYMSLFLACFQISILLWRYKSFLTFEIFFVVLYHVFAFGRLYLMTFGKDEYIFWNLLNYYSDIEKWQAGMLALSVSQGLVTGFLLYRQVSSMPNNNSGGEEDFTFFGLTPHHMFMCGLLFFILTEPITIYVAIKNIAAVRVAGRYADAELSGVIGCLSYVSPVGIIMMIVSKYKKKQRILLILLIYDIISLMIATFTADRRYVVTAILITFLAYLRAYNVKIRPARAIIYGFLGIFVLAIINSIRIVRTTSVVSFSLILENVFSGNFDIFETFYTSLAEFGITFFTYLEVVHYYPVIFSYKYGITYLLGPITLIPGIGQIIPSISGLVSIPAPIEKVVMYSVGGSFGEELYGNFGMFGIALSLVAGYIISKFMRGRFTENTSGYQVAKYYIMFYYFINLVRATFNEMLRSVVWTFVILYFVRIVIARTISRESLQ